MSVTEINSIDGIAKEKSNKELVLLITDHLDWENEFKHLKVLQDKINSYLEFIETKQYEEIYPKEEFQRFIIEIHFKNNLVENCVKFLNTVANQLESYNIKIRIEVS